MKKVVRLTESDLVRLVKRVINEQKVGNERYHYWADLEKSLTSYGFKRDKAIEGVSDKFLALSKGNDYDGISILFNKDKYKMGWSVVVGGKSKVDKEYTINMSNTDNIGNEGNKVYNMIMSDIKPYLNMKIRPMPNEG